MSNASPGREEISFNLPVDTPELRAGVEKFSSGSMLHGNRYVTVIKSEYQDRFRRGVLHIMRGLVAADIRAARLPDGREVQASIFGFSVDFAQTGPQTALVIPNMHRLFVPTIDDPYGAMHSFHQTLIANTNEALSTLKAPFVLAPVPE